MTRIAIELTKGLVSCIRTKKDLLPTKLEKRTKLCNLFQDNNQMYTTAAETKKIS